MRLRLRVRVRARVRVRVRVRVRSQSPMLLARRPHLVAGHLEVKLEQVRLSHLELVKRLLQIRSRRPAPLPQHLVRAGLEVL